MIQLLLHSDTVSINWVSITTSVAGGERIIPLLLGLSVLSALTYRHLARLSLCTCMQVLPSCLGDSFILHPCFYLISLNECLQMQHNAYFNAFHVLYVVFFFY